MSRLYEPPAGTTREYWANRHASQKAAYAASKETPAYRREAVRQRKLFEDSGINIVTTKVPHGWVNGSWVVTGPAKTITTPIPPCGPAARVAEFLLTTKSTQLTWPEVFRACKVHSLAQTAVRRSRTVESVLKACGWTEKRRKDVGIKGNGSVLIRAA